jgi:hypothetical protein
MKKYNSIKIGKNKKTQKKCMDVSGGYKGNNGRIILYPCHNGPNQKFHYNRTTKQLKNKYSKKCVDLDNTGRLVQQKCASSKTQKWIKRKTNWISLKNKKCIGLEKSRSRCREQDPKVLGDLVTKRC